MVSKAHRHTHTHKHISTTINTQNTNKHSIITPPHIEVQSIAISVSVCYSLSVCFSVYSLSVGISLKTKFSLHVTCGRGSVL